MKYIKHKDGNIHNNEVGNLEVAEFAGKHTPGSWNTHRVTESGSSNGYIQITANGEVIAHLRDRFNIDQGKLEKQQGNARLIAAAPDLLEALDVVRVEMYVCGLSEDTQKSVMAAIAKAKGEPYPEGAA